MVTTITVDDTRPILDVRAELAIVTHRYRTVVEALGLDPHTTSHNDVIELLRAIVDGLDLET